MIDSNSQEEVGDLFVTETALTLKLMPSRKSGTVTIRWFAKKGSRMYVWRRRTSRLSSGSCAAAPRRPKPDRDDQPRS